MIGIEDVEAMAAVVKVDSVTAKKPGVKPKVLNDMFWTQQQGEEVQATNQPESRHMMRGKLFQLWRWRLEDVLCIRKCCA